MYIMRVIHMYSLDICRVDAGAPVIATTSGEFMPGNATATLADSAPPQLARISSSLAMVRQSSKVLENSQEDDMGDTWIDQVMRPPEDAEIPPGQPETTPQKAAPPA